MLISKHPTKVSITFSPSEYWLRKNMYQPEWYGEYCLTQRVDMSYKGKDDQEGSVIIYLNSDQAEEFRKAGFDEISGGYDPTVPIFVDSVEKK